MTRAGGPGRVEPKNQSLTTEGGKREFGEWKERLEN